MIWRMANNFSVFPMSDDIRHWVLTWWTLTTIFFWDIIYIKVSLSRPSLDGHFRQLITTLTLLLLYITLNVPAWRMFLATSVSQTEKHYLCMNFFVQILLHFTPLGTFLPPIAVWLQLFLRYPQLNTPFSGNYQFITHHGDLKWNFKLKCNYYTSDWQYQFHLIIGDKLGKLTLLL